LAAFDQKIREPAMKDLSTGELAELRQNFDTCDANGDGDGTISFEEFMGWWTGE